MTIESAHDRLMDAFQALEDMDGYWMLCKEFDDDGNFVDFAVVDRETNNVVVSASDIEELLQKLLAKEREPRVEQKA